jgi:hypothetical protein
MTFDEVIAHLQRLANPENIAGMARFGINPKPTLGISIRAVLAVTERARGDRETGSGRVSTSAFRSLVNSEVLGLGICAVTARRSPVANGIHIWASVQRPIPVSVSEVRLCETDPHFAREIEVVTPADPARSRGDPGPSPLHRPSCVCRPGAPGGTYAGAFVRVFIHASTVSRT